MPFCGQEKNRLKPSGFNRSLVRLQELESWTPLIKSQMLYQLSYRHIYYAVRITALIL